MTIPMKDRATLVAAITVKVEPPLKQDWRDLDAKGVDVSEIVRQFLRTELPKVKKKLESA